jgi:hypothetical protein
MFVSGLQRQQHTTGGGICAIGDSWRCRADTGGYPTTDTDKYADAYASTLGYADAYTHSAAQPDTDSGNTHRAGCSQYGDTRRARV